MAPPDARKVALDILQRVEREESYASVLLRSVRGLSSRDAALAGEIVNGVLRRRRWLDHVLGHFSSRPIDRIDPSLLILLRIGLYQILYLDRVPDHAAVDSTVNLTRSLGKKRSFGASFVNGILRNLLRARGKLPEPPDWRRSPDPVAALCLAGSCPRWLVERWVSRLGPEETDRLIASINRPARGGLRVAAGVDAGELSGRLAREGVAVHPSRFHDRFLVVDSGAPQHTEAFREGLIYIQDEASGLVAAMAGVRPGDRILDACAAPGGKALIMAEKAGRDGLVVAADRHLARLRLLDSNRTRMRCVSVAPVACDMSGEAPFLNRTGFDVVLVDAPCTGTGVIRRHPEIRERVDGPILAEIAKIQARLLRQAAGLVRPAGALVYAVCSLEPEEGLGQLQGFLEANPVFRVDDPSPYLPERARQLVEVSPVGPCLMTWPQRDDLDGFFAVRLIKKATCTSGSEPSVSG